MRLGSSRISSSERPTCLRRTWTYASEHCSSRTAPNTCRCRYTASKICGIFKFSGGLPRSVFLMSYKCLSNSYKMPGCPQQVSNSWTSSNSRPGQFLSSLNLYTLYPYSISVRLYNCPVLQLPAAQSPLLAVSRGSTLVPSVAQRLIPRQT